MSTAPAPYCALLGGVGFLAGKSAKWTEWIGLVSMDMRCHPCRYSMVPKRLYVLPCDVDVFLCRMAGNEILDSQWACSATQICMWCTGHLLCCMTQAVALACRPGAQGGARIAAPGVHGGDGAARPARGCGHHRRDPGMQLPPGTPWAVSSSSWCVVIWMSDAHVTLAGSIDTRNL